MEILVLITFITFIAMNKIRVQREYLYLMSFFIFLVLISLFWAVDKYLLLTQCIHLVSAFFIFVMILQPVVEKKWMAGAFVAGLVIPGMFAIAQFTEGQSFASKWFGLAARNAETLGDAVITDADGNRILRAYGSFSHPNIFGGYLAVGIPMLFMLINDTKNLSWMYWYGTAGIFGLFILILTWSQASWIALLIGAFVMASGYAIYLVRQGKINILRAAQFAAGGFIGLMVAVIIGMVLVSGSESRSMNERLIEYAEWSQVTGGEAIQTFFGNHYIETGFHQYSLRLCSVFPEKEWWQCIPIHNVWFLMAAELGRFSIVFLAAVIIILVKTIFEKQRNEDQILALTLLSIILILSLFDHFLYSSWSGMALLGTTIGFMLKPSQLAND